MQWIWGIYMEQNGLLWKCDFPPLHALMFLRHLSIHLRILLTTSHSCFYEVFTMATGIVEGRGDKIHTGVKGGL